MSRRIAAVVAVLVALSPGTALACPVCFGAADGPMLQGSNMGILALLVVTLVMLTAFGLFFVHLIRRAAAAADATPSQLAHEHAVGRPQ